MTLAITWAIPVLPWFKQTERPSALHGYGVLDTFRFGTKISISLKFEPDEMSLFLVVPILSISKIEIEL